HERHRREVVELVRPNLVDRSNERQLVEQVGRFQRDAIEQMFDAPEIGRARSADETEDFVPIVEQQLSEIRAVLSGNSGDNGSLGHESWDFSMTTAREVDGTREYERERREADRRYNDALTALDREIVQLTTGPLDRDALARASTALIV